MSRKFYPVSYVFWEGARGQLLARTFVRFAWRDGKSEGTAFMIKWKMMKLITSSPPLVYGYWVVTKGCSEITILSCSYPCTIITISNTDKSTHILLNHHFINTICNSNMFHSLKGYFHEVKLINSSSVCQQHESLVVKFNLVCGVYCAM